MDPVYDVYMGKLVVGQVNVQKHGLYYHFCCNCRLSGEVIYRIVAICDNQQINLGVCVPKGNGFGLETSIPIKQIGDRIDQFRAVPKHAEGNAHFVAVRPEEPFSYLEKLNRAYLAVRGSDVGVMLED